MASSPPRAEQMLAAVQAGLPGLPPAGGQTRQTARVLTEWARAWPAPPTEKAVAGLHALCRKIAVTKKLLAAYDESWKAPPGACALDEAFWPLLIAVFLARAEAGQHGEARGLALKCLNAALTTLDIVDETGNGATPHAPALRDWARELLDALTCEAPE